MVGQHLFFNIIPNNFTTRTKRIHCFGQVKLKMYGHYNSNHHFFTFHSPSLPSACVDVIIYPTIPHTTLTLFMAFSVTYYTQRYAMLDVVIKSVSSYSVKYVVYFIYSINCILSWVSSVSLSSVIGFN